MGDLGKDAKDLLIGKDNSEKEPEDFKIELQNAVKKELITKANGTLLITARESSDKLGATINKKQVSGTKVKDGKVYDSEEEIKKDKKKKERQYSSELKSTQGKDKSKKAKSQNEREE